MAHKGTLLSLIKMWASEFGNEDALHERNSDGSWSTISWRDYWSAIRCVGKGLISLGLEPNNAVALVGANQMNWVICQHGINAAQGIPAPLYPTLLPEQMEYIVGNANSKIVICDDQIQLDKYLSIAGQDSPIDHIITMTELSCSDARVISLAELMIRGEEHDDAELDSRLCNVQPEDVALLIYTSGTTGLPKGAMITHEGIDAVSKGIGELFGDATNSPRIVSYLPLCHVAEQAMTNFAGISFRSQIFFCRDLADVRDHLLVARPTIFLGVPRVWEKFESALRGQLAGATGFKAMLTQWARDVELKSFMTENSVGRPYRSLSRTLANKLVISKIKNALGLDQLLLALVGAAPISISTLEFFASIGISVHEGFGMTETSGIASMQPVGRIKFGTIGVAIPGAEVMIAEDGEIMLRGKGMVKGYFRLPEKTRELYNHLGWMHTGDLGAIDSDGYISITGRKKDIIITAGGKNIAPAEMEGHLQSIAGVGQVVVVGDRQPYLSALIVLDPELLPALEKAAGLKGLKDVEGSAKNPEVKKYIEEQMEIVCNNKVAKYQTIKRIHVLPNVFSVDGGELTPTLKVKRNIINEKYADEISALFSES
jgi:long-subunit acyl-CoA synthetase (AMP-forming)